MTNLEFLEELLRDEPQEVDFHVEQFGPLRRFDKEMRCASRGCGSSTFFRVRGIPRCISHALRELNEMLVELGITK